ncbi:MULTISPECIES: hypothetical protein [unclassified Nocardia]|uniref:hypothetical protein n=1 Tax=unclassified Nocardia TaxID=2637762 RepID=UPI001CE48917|nr:MULTISPECIES: hypothetical protein [unclassified Nocardia]
MRLRAAIAGGGLAILAFIGATPAAHAVETRSYTQQFDPQGGTWHFIEWYSTESKCIDGGQQFQREHAISEWSCDFVSEHHPPSWGLSGR